MRIAFVVPSLQNGGAERMVSTLANHYAKNSVVHIITLLQKEIFYEIDDSIKIQHVRNSSPSSNQFQAIFKNIYTLNNLIHILKKENIDIVLSFTTTANVLSTIACKILKIPNIISERNNSLVNPPKKFWLKLRNRLYKHAAFLVVQTDGNKKIFETIVPENQIRIIHNAISETLNSKSDDFGHRVKTASPIEILSVGRLNDNKAHHIGITALAGLTDYEWNYTIAGSGPLKKNLIELCKKLRIDHRVNFTGSVKNIEDYYKKSDIFIFTSRSEGFPNALMEAYYFGLPSISTNCKFGPSDIISDNEDGFLIPVDSVSELRNKIKMLLENNELRAEIAKLARLNAERFNILNITKNGMN